MRVLACCVAAVLADNDYVSMLQMRAAKHAVADGVCGLGVFTKSQAKADATIADMLDEFKGKCTKSYTTTLCSSLEEELFDGVDGDTQIANNPSVPRICEELSALILADLEHKEVEAAGSTTLVSGSVEGAVSTKDGRDELETKAERNLLEEAQETVTQTSISEDADTEVNAKAVDDPHLTSIHGTHFDLYSSGKYTLLTVPRHARSDSANLIVDAYVERIGERKNDLWIRRLTIGGAWVGEKYSFKTSSGEFGSDGTHLVRVGHGDWVSPEQVAQRGAASFRILPTKAGDAPSTDFAQTNSKRVEVQCGPVSALVKWATVQKNGQDVNHIDFRMHGLHGLGGDVGGLLADEYDMEGDLPVSLLNGHDAVVTKRHHSK